MSVSYHVWRIGLGGPVLLGYIDGHDYMDARHRAERAYGGPVEVYLPPRRHVAHERATPPLPPGQGLSATASTTQRGHFRKS